LIRNGIAPLWELHWERLSSSCERLLINTPLKKTIEKEIESLTVKQSDGVLKIIITRGASERGYGTPKSIISNRVLSLSSLPTESASKLQEGVSLGVCSIRLAQQPRLAGMKTLNRLENVLAWLELQETGVEEGLLLDQNENVIEAVMSNLFVVKNDKLVTPKLDQCGVSGVRRRQVLEIARQQNLQVSEQRLQLADIANADEVFLTNAVVGIRPVRQLQHTNYNLAPQGNPVTRKLMHEIAPTV
jgi:4-amino-4-deoxychorismate lyase